MEEKTKITSLKNNHIFPKKIYQNPFKEDIIYKSNKIKTKKIAIIKKDNFIINSNLIRKLSKISTEKSIMKQSLKHHMSQNDFNSNINIMNLNKTNYLKSERKFENASMSIDFKKNSAVIKQLTDINNNGDKIQEAKIIFNKNKGKNIFQMNSKLICNKNCRNNNYRNKNYKLINNISNKINTESTININTNKLLRNFNKPNLQNSRCNKYKKFNLNINFSCKIVKNKRWLKENVVRQDKNNTNFNNDKNNLVKNNKIYESDENILINKTENQNKLKNNKNLDNSINKKVQSLNINNSKMNKESSQRIVQTTKKSTENKVKGFNYTILANSKSANTKPTNISSFVISEKIIEQDNNASKNNCKITEKSPLKSTNLKEHMKFINLNSNEIKLLFPENRSKTKESDSKFLNYELGQTNGLSITDSIFCSLENSYKDEKDKNKIIECEHSIEYMEKLANKILNSNKNLELVHKNKKDKDSYCDLTDNNTSILNEFKNDESIHKIINYQINLK